MADPADAKADNLKGSSRDVINYCNLLPLFKSQLSPTHTGNIGKYENYEIH
jgi:hypothetical protein